MTDEASDIAAENAAAIVLLREELRMRTAERDEARFQLETILRSMHPTAEQAIDHQRVANRLQGYPESVLFDRFRSEYLYAIGALNVANELLDPVAEALRFNGNLEILGSWITKSLPGHILSYLATQYRRFLEENGAENYVEIYLGEGDRRVIVTLQRAEGQTPDQLRRAAVAGFVAMREERDERPAITGEMAAGLMQVSDPNLRYGSNGWAEEGHAAALEELRAHAGCFDAKTTLGEDAIHPDVHDETRDDVAPDGDA